MFESFDFSLCVSSSLFISPLLGWRVSFSVSLRPAAPLHIYILLIHITNPTSEEIKAHLHSQVHKMHSDVRVRLNSLSRARHRHCRGYGFKSRCDCMCLKYTQLFSWRQHNVSSQRVEVLLRVTEEVNCFCSDLLHLVKQNLRTSAETNFHFIETSSWSISSNQTPKPAFEPKYHQLSETGRSLTVFLLHLSRVLKILIESESSQILHQICLVHLCLFWNSLVLFDQTFTTETLSGLHLLHQAEQTTSVCFSACRSSSSRLSLISFSCSTNLMTTDETNTVQSFTLQLTWSHLVSVKTLRYLNSFACWNPAANKHRPAENWGLKSNRHFS